MTLELIIKIDYDGGIKQREFLICKHRDVPGSQNSGNSAGIAKRYFRVPAFLRRNILPDPRRSDGRFDLLFAGIYHQRTESKEEKKYNILKFPFLNFEFFRRKRMRLWRSLLHCYCVSPPIPALTNSCKWTIPTGRSWLSTTTSWEILCASISCRATAASISCGIVLGCLFITISAVILVTSGVF